MLNKFVRNTRNLFILGALLAAVAFVLVFYTLSKAQSPAASAQSALPQAPPELVATQNIPALTQLSDPQSASRFFSQVPVKGYVDPSYVKGQDGLAYLLTPAGGGPRHVAFNLVKGQPLLASELVTYTAPGVTDYSTLLKPGEVAETVKVPALAADNGVVQPGDHVNLLLSLKFNLTLRDILSGKYKIYIPTSDNNITPQTTLTSTVGYLYQSQTTMENLRVLGVAADNYTLAMNNQEAVILKFIKEWSAGSEARYIADLVVRSASDADGNHYFTTDSITPDFLLNAKYTHHNKITYPK